MRRHFIIVTCIALGLTGCTSSVDHLIEPNKPSQSSQSSHAVQATPMEDNYETPSPEKKVAYEKKMRNIASGIKDDPNYQRLSLDTAEKKEWFKTLTYRLWDRQITRQQFITEGLKRYPNNGYEFNFIVRGFTFD